MKCCSSEKESQQTKRLPIDRGWAWVIVFGNMFLFSLVSGGFKSQGVILVEVSERYPNRSPTFLLWIFSLSNLLNRLSGPLNSWVINRFSHRVCSIGGVLFLVVALVGTAFVVQPEWYFLFYSVFWGIGSGAVSISSFTAASPYFEKRKALAIGLIAAGSGFGTLVTPNLLRALFDNFSYFGAFLLYGGYAFQFMVFAALMRPLSFYERLYKIKRDEELSSVGESEEDKKSSALELDADNNEVEVDVLSPPDQHTTHTHRNHHHHSLITDESLMIASTGDLSASFTSIYSASKRCETNENNKEVAEEVDKEPSRLMEYWILLKDPRMIMLGCSILLYGCGTSVVYSCIPPLGKSRDVSKDIIAICLAGAGVLEFPSRISNGVIADRNYMSAIMQFTLCIFCTSIASLVCAISSGLPGIIVMLVGMSTCGTSVYSLAPIVIEELFGKDKVVSGIGVFYMFQAVSFIAGTPLGGFMYEYFGMWEAVYYSCFGVMFLGSLVNAPYLIYHRMKKRRETAK